MVKAAHYDAIERVMTNGSNIVEGIISKEINSIQLTSEKHETSVTLTWNTLD